MTDDTTTRPSLEVMAETYLENIGTPPSVAKWKAERAHGNYAVRVLADSLQDALDERHRHCLDGEQLESARTVARLSTDIHGHFHPQHTQHPCWRREMRRNSQYLLTCYHLVAERA